MKKLLVTVAAVVMTTAAHAQTTCVGEPISSRAIGGRQSDISDVADSAIDKCFFFSDSSIGRQIDKVCSVRDAEPAIPNPKPTCRVKAVTVRAKGVDVIKRIISVERLP
jgi:hypothetical protein